MVSSWKLDADSLLEPEDLAALTMEASALAQVPLAGSQHTDGRPDPPPPPPRNILAKMA